MRMTLVAFAIVLPTFVTWVYFSLLATYPASSQRLAYSIGKTIQFALPIVGLLLLGSWMKSAAPNYKKSLIAGVSLGLLICLSMYFLYAFALKPLGVMDSAQTEVKAKLKEMQIGSVFVFACIAIGYALVHSLLEEYYWRWFVFGNLTKVSSLSVAVTISSIGFAAHHVIVLARYFGWSNPWTYLLSACIAIGGAIWAWLYQRHGTLLGPWVSHGLVDAMIFVIGYQMIFA